MNFNDNVNLKLIIYIYSNKILQFCITKSYKKYKNDTKSYKNIQREATPKKTKKENAQDIISKSLQKI